MNFALDEAQSVIAASAAEVLREADPAAAWQALAKAGLLALTLPGWMGGDDLGAGAAAVLLTEVGRQAAQVPALATIMLGSLPVVRWGSRELQERILAGVGAGETILTAAGGGRSSGIPAISATVAGPHRPPSAASTPNETGGPLIRRATLIPGACSRPGGQAHRAPRCVRPPAGRVPGGRRSGPRRLQRQPDPAPRLGLGMLGARGGPGRQRGRRRGGVLARQGSAGRAADLPSAARRNRPGHQLSAAPLLGDDHRPGQVRRRRGLPS